MDISAVSSGFSALQGLLGIAKNIVEVRDLTKLASIQVELQQRILDVQGAMLDMQEKLAAKSEALDALKAHTAKLENATRDRERYALHEISPGAFVYRRRDGVPPPEPMHYLCQPCLDKGVKAVLQLMVSGLHGKIQNCPVCNRHISVS
jgi:hypothetical protein